MFKIVFIIEGAWRKLKINTNDYWSINVSILSKLADKDIIINDYVMELFVLDFFYEYEHKKLGLMGKKDYL